MTRLSYRKAEADDGKNPCWMLALKGKSGVYVIRRQSDHRVLYVGESHSGRLSDTLTRHFRRWHEAERPHFVYARRAVEVAVRVTSKTHAVASQNRLIKILKPRDNTNGLE